MALPLLQQPLLHGDASQEVQRGERLVQQQQVAAGEHGAGKGRPLAHTAGKLVRPLVPAAVQPHIRQRRVDHVTLLRLGVPALYLQRKRQILPDGAPRKQHILLRHIAAVVLPRRDGLSIDGDGAGLRRQQTVDHAENGAFAAAADADDAVERPRLHGKGEAIDDVEVLAGVLVGDVVKAQNTHGCTSHAISQKPSSYRLQLTNTSVR